MKGLFGIWQVGNGESIWIWGDRWISSKGSHVVQSPMRLLSMDAKVSALLDLDTNWWKTDLVEAVFGVEKAKETYSMVVCPRRRED